MTAATTDKTSLIVAALKKRGRCDDPEQQIARAIRFIESVTGCPCICRERKETLWGNDRTLVQLKGCCIKEIVSVIMSDPPRWRDVELEEGVGWRYDGAGGLCRDTGCCSAAWPKGCKIEVEYLHGCEELTPERIECIADVAGMMSGCKPQGPLRTRQQGSFSETYAVESIKMDGPVPAWVTDQIKQCFDC